MADDTDDRILGTDDDGAVDASIASPWVTIPPSGCGIVVAPDGARLQVPTVPAGGPDPADLYNDCTGSGHNPTHLEDLETVVIDPDGEAVYVNGMIVAGCIPTVW